MGAAFRVGKKVEKTEPEAGAAAAANTQARRNPKRGSKAPAEGVLTVSSCIIYHFC